MRIQTTRLTAGVLLACAAFVAHTGHAASPTGTTPSTPADSTDPRIGNALVSTLRS